MVDAHYDLLSICYNCYLKNDYSKIEEIAKKINNNKNIKCIFANLYFMSIEEMKEELDELHKEGLKSIILVWNTENQYGSGNRTQKGLTKEGIEFINKAIDLGIGIDLSHANKNLGKKVICYASHSNSRVLCNKERNLDDNQLQALKEVGGLVGVFCNKHFVTKEYDLSSEEVNKLYLEHIIHISKIVGIDNVMLSTDNLSFMIDIDPEYEDTIMFDYSNLEEEIAKLLQTHFSISATNKIMYENVSEKIINKLNNKNKFK